MKSYGAPTWVSTLYTSRSKFWWLGDLRATLSGIFQLPSNQYEVTDLNVSITLKVTRLLRIKILNNMEFGLVKFYLLYSKINFWDST